MAPGRLWIRRGLLHHSTVLQSFAFDERRGHMYALQVMQGGVRLPGEMLGAIQNRDGFATPDGDVRG
ncbi:hypothetical protein [Streptomyces mirabilis]|uniref:hypothetical protein n=1 Tax=Streptomyces mirabilis TaxID=68239 RepID=UPI0036BEB026